MTWRTFQRTDGISHSSGGTAATGIKKDGPAHSSAWAGRRLAPRPLSSQGCSAWARQVGKWQCGVSAAVDGPPLDETKEPGPRPPTAAACLPLLPLSSCSAGRPAWWPPRHKAKPGADKSLRNGLFLRSGFSEGSDQPSRSKSKLLRSTIYGCPCLI